MCYNRIVTNFKMHVLRKPWSKSGKPKILPQGLFLGSTRFSGPFRDQNITYTTSKVHLHNVQAKQHEIVCICKLVTFFILAGSFRELYSINCKLLLLAGTYRCCLEVELSRASAGPGTGDSRTSEGPSSLLLPRSPLPTTTLHVLPSLRLLQRGDRFKTKP